MGIIDMSDGNKIVIITENKRLYQALSNVIKKKDCIIETGIPALCDLNLIKTQVKIYKNTAFLRKAYSDFVKINGSPPLSLVLDYRIELGLEKSIDPDKKKVFRTFLISSVIFTKSHNFKSGDTINMILIGAPKDVREFEIFKDYPHIVFKTVRTTNQTINSFLDYYMKNPSETKKIFHFDYLVIDESNDVVEPAKKFEKILDKLREHKERIVYKEKVKGQTPIMEGMFEPAKIMYKISDARLYVDGEILNIENNPEYNEYQPDIIYIVGYYVNSTLQEVNKKLERFLTDDLPKIRKVTPEEKIILSLNSHTVIDGATTHALNTLLSYKLHEFKNIVIITSDDNYRKMENSPGFISLRKFITKRI